MHMTEIAGLVERLRGDLPETTVEKHHGCLDMPAIYAMMEEAADALEGFRYRIDWYQTNYSEMVEQLTAAKAEIERLREALEDIADKYGDVASANIARAALCICGKPLPHDVCYSRKPTSHAPKGEEEIYLGTYETEK